MSNYNAKTSDITISQWIDMPNLGNKFCADCFASNPDWAAYNIGVRFCVFILIYNNILLFMI